MTASFRGANASIFVGGPSYRFVRHYDQQGKPKGYTNSYRIVGEDGVTIFGCDTVGYGHGRETEFHAGEAGSVAFRFCPNRRIMAFDYTAVDAGGAVIGQARMQTGFGNRYCSLRDAGGIEQAMLIDPAPWTERYIGQAMGNVTGAYVFVADPKAKDQPPLASLARERSREPITHTGLRGFMLKLMAGTDWVLRLAPAAADRIDHRLMIAACLHHQENQVRADQSS